MIYMIAALSKNKQIGFNGQMPWHIPEDLSYFRKVTTGHPVIMGRKTYESIGRLLPGRHNIILTQNPNFTLQENALTPSKPFNSGTPTLFSKDSATTDLANVDIVHSAYEALALLPQDTPTFIIGGGEIYKMFYPYADKLYLTMIDKVVEGDTAFPCFENDFECMGSSPGNSFAEAGLHFDFTIWERRHK